MKLIHLLASALASSLVATAAPLGPNGPCADSLVDQILKGDLDPAVCCSYGKCKGDVVVSVGE